MGGRHDPKTRSASQLMLMITQLELLYLRDLDRLKAELIAYNNASIMWETPGEIANSAGNLCLHLLGNLNHFIGTHLGGTSYVRQRPLEFSVKNVQVTTMISQIDDLKIVISKALKGLKLEQLEADYPILVFSDQRQVTIGFMLQHLLGHLNYHLGQINYHRRLLDN